MVENNRTISGNIFGFEAMREHFQSPVKTREEQQEEDGNGEEDLVLESCRRYVEDCCRYNNIDWSHGAAHAEDVLGFINFLLSSCTPAVTENASGTTTDKGTGTAAGGRAHTAVYEELSLSSREVLIIQVSALLHDTVDGKYCDEVIATERVKTFLLVTLHFSTHDISTVLFLISTISYSKVKKRGYPQELRNNKGLEESYHLLRVCDLLAGYDPERSVMYNFFKGKVGTRGSITEAVEAMRALFEVRVLKYIEDGLMDNSPVPMTTSIANELHNRAKYVVSLGNEQIVERMRVN